MLLVLHGAAHGAWASPVSNQRPLVVLLASKKAKSTKRRELIERSSGRLFPCACKLNEG